MTVQPSAGGVPSTPVGDETGDLLDVLREDDCGHGHDPSLCGECDSPRPVSSPVQGEAVEVFDPGDPITSGDLIEDHDGAPLPHELQRGGRISQAVWDVLIRRLPDEASPDEIMGCHEGVLIALAPILWPLLQLNDRTARPAAVPTAPGVVESLTREALIEAGARAIGDPDDFGFAGERDGRAEGCRTLSEDILDAALPLIADAIEQAEPTGVFDGGGTQQHADGRLVRSFGGGQ